MAERPGKGRALRVKDSGRPGERAGLTALAERIRARRGAAAAGPERGRGRGAGDGVSQRDVGAPAATRPARQAAATGSRAPPASLQRTHVGGCQAAWSRSTAIGTHVSAVVSVRVAR